MSASHKTFDETGFKGKVLALCGGVGGAKLAWGLAQVLPPGRLTVVVNTGDDFEHLGLHISPDLDTVMYTLAGINNPELGWGLAGETWQCMAAMEKLGGDTWFLLGDRDIATHFRRTELLQQGKSLTHATQQLCAALGVQHRMLPMCDQPLRTLVNTDEGTLAFQDYFVRRQCKPVVQSVHYSGADKAQLSAEVKSALDNPDLRAVIICPSNPLLSIAPILAVPGMREALCNTLANVMVVSPLIGGKAVKGPTAKMMHELAMPLDSNSICQFYADVLDTLVIDSVDKNEVNVLCSYAIDVQACQTLMMTDSDRIALARALLALL